MMGLNNASPPTNGEELVSSKIGLLIRHSLRGADFFGDIDIDNIFLSAPHGTYFIGLEDVAGGHLLDKVQQTGWRYILLEGTRAFASAEVDKESDTEELSFSNFSTGDQIANTISALEMAENFPETLSGDYEVRFLRIPSLYIIAIWLKGDDDILMPLVSAHGLRPLGKYSEEEILKLLQPRAQQVLAFSAVTDSGDI
jgi:hypothetical protein